MINIIHMPHSGRFLFDPPGIKKEMKYILNIVVLLTLLTSTTLYAEEIAIIANKTYPANHISLTALKEIYLGEKNTESGIRIKPYDQKSTSLRKKFLTKVLGVNEDGYNAYWIKKVFQEGGVPPVMQATSEEVIRTIKEEPGGIGYIWRHEGDLSGIKILLTIEVGD